jgi:nitroreductase
VQNICLSATNYGIGSLWICDSDICPDEIKSHLGVTEEPHKLAALVSLGYAAESPYARPRKAFENICKFR